MGVSVCVFVCCENHKIIIIDEKSDLRTSNIVLVFRDRNYIRTLYAWLAQDYDYSMDENIAGTCIESHFYHFADEIGHFGLGEHQFWYIGTIRC